MPGGSNRKQRIIEAFDALCGAIARALGAAEGRRDAAVRAHAEAMVEMWLREDGLESVRADPGLGPLLANKKLFGPVARVEADRHAAFTPWLEHGPDELTQLLAAVAPGAASRAHTEWLGQAGKIEPAGPVPDLWYLGQGRIGNRPTDGFPVAVPLLDESHLQVGSTPKGRETAEALVQNLLLRVMSYFRPGLVQLHVWDTGSVAGTLPGLYPLTRNGLLTVHDPKRLPQLLDELSDRIRRIHTRVLVDGHPSLRAMGPPKEGERTEPWVVAVLIGNRNNLREEDHRQLQRVARGGLACRIQLVLLDVPVTLNAPVETVQVEDDGRARSSMTGAYVRVTPEPALEPGDITDACREIAREYDDWRSRVAVFHDLFPAGEWGQQHSHEGLEAPIGFVEGELEPIRIADSSPHVLIGGPSGSGKTNLLLTMISSLAAQYSPDDLAFYLLDFKEGVSFAQFAPGPQGKTWLPHAKLVGVNINTDREFGLALLQFLSEEMRRRAAAAKSVGVSKLEELRRYEDEHPPAEPRPRIVAVIDEFQYLFAENDAVTKASAVLLEDVARRGRSQGIHLVLASQDTSGIQVFWGRPAVFEQFVLRIALPRARRVLVDTNDAAIGLPRWHAVVNDQSGTKHGNQIVRIPDASTKGLVEGVVRQLHEQYVDPDDAEPAEPVLFDGSRSPRIEELIADLPPSEDGQPRAVLGQCIDVTGRAATVRLSATPGRNIGVLGSVGKDAVPMLTAAAYSVADQYPDGVTLVLAPLVGEARDPGRRLAEQFRARYRDESVETVQLNELSNKIAELSAEVAKRLAGKVEDPKPVLVVLYAADAADTVLDRAGTDNLRRLMRLGPETGVHVLGWWRSIQRLRGLLTLGATVDDLGAWVALDVHGAELGPLVPGMMVSWAPRPGRGMFFDRAQHASPEVIIVPSVEAL
jgi:DNA segregation ATPase FtsK/SpoIIIE, S-DNA-T family